jgi:hypothetical protein
MIRNGARRDVPDAVLDNGAVVAILAAGSYPATLCLLASM